MVVLNINGKAREIEADTDTPLLWILRDQLDLTGAKFGCGAGLCGACTVHLDGEPVFACQVQSDQIGAAKITTIEAVEGVITAAVLRAWQEIDVAQCGYCQPGQIMRAIGLLGEVKSPTDEDIDDYMGGNVCRCATYVRIRSAIHLAAKMLEEAP